MDGLVPILTAVLWIWLGTILYSLALAGLSVFSDEDTPTIYEWILILVVCILPVANVVINTYELLRMLTEWVERKSNRD